MSRKYYWKQKNGKKIDVDVMDEKHLRNTLKMIIRNAEKLATKKSVVSESRIGNIESNFFEDMYDDYIDECFYEF